MARETSKALGSETHGRGVRAVTETFREREDFYRSILDSLAEGVLITDRDSRILYANRSLEELTGHTRDELAGKVSYEVLSPRQNWPTMRRRLRERLSGKSDTYQHELITKDGQVRWVSVRASPYRDSTGEIVGTVGAMMCIDREKALEQQNEYLWDELRQDGQFGEIVGHSGALAKVLDQIKTVAATDATVLICGESGTGKELVVRAIHELGPRAHKPLVRVNCAAIPKDLFESEFFGHVRGSFTGAIQDRVGRFELANGGTLFLDEVGEIPLDLQSKLLRVIQEHEFERIGEGRTRTADVRIISATNRELSREAREGRFRLDLYYRLSVFPIEIPPLRERREDIVPLAEHFLRISSRRLGIPVPELSAEQKQSLEYYDWPGNVRELQNVIERATILASRGGFRLDVHGPAQASIGPMVTEHDRSAIERALRQSRGKIYGANGAAALLGMKPTTLTSRLARLGLRRADYLHG